MTHKLLNKTFRLYLLCNIIILIVAAPTFYFSIIGLYIEDTDETLLLYKKEFYHYYLPHFKKTEIENWNRYNRNIKIEPMSSAVRSDTLFYKNYIDTLDNENEPYRVLQSPLIIENNPYLFVAKISLVESEDLIKSIFIIFIILIALLLAVLGFITKRFSKIIWQPFRNTLEKLKSFNLTTRKAILFDKTDIQEFEELNYSLQKLIDKNLSVYNQQKVFVENASHELQTPLAVLKSKIDLLLQNKNITKEQLEILSTISLPLSRITRINKNLLLLAKIENNQFTKKESLELTEIVNETIELLDDYITEKQIIVHKNLTEKLFIVCNKTLLEILISNLIINTIVHNTEQGNTCILFSGRTLTVSNTGRTALNREKLFERFAISSSETTNSGLGLSIVKEICNRYQWQVHYAFENNLHSFSVVF
ncbi:MAG: HAMP domain-containing sensor histidine kinase [Spirosomataceae bacterium]